MHVIYIASPYTHADPAVRRQRFDDAATTSPSACYRAPLCTRRSCTRTP